MPSVETYLAKEKNEKKSHYHLRLPKDLFEDLVKLSKQRDISINKIIIAAIKLFLDTARKEKG